MALVSSTRTPPPPFWRAAASGTPQPPRASSFRLPPASLCLASLLWFTPSSNTHHTRFYFTAVALV